MARISNVLRSLAYPDGQSRRAFWCPECESYHAIPVSGGGAWSFNGNEEAPTFAPSILVRGGHYGPGGEAHCWCKYNAARIAGGKEPSGFACRICHSFVTDGRIQFLGDCTHALVGQTVDLPTLPDDEDGA